MQHVQLYVPIGNSEMRWSTVSTDDPAHATSSRARSRRGHAAGRPVGGL